MGLFSKLNTKDLVILFDRSTGPLHDSRIRKIMCSLSDKGLDCEGMLFTRSNSYSKHYYKPNAWVFTQPILISSKNPIRGSAIINFIEIIQETFMSCIYILYRRPKYLIMQNHRSLLIILFSILFYKRIFKTRIIWDLRELPNGLMEGFFRITLTNFIFRNCDSIIVVNQSRLDLMRKIYGENNLQNASVVCNYENSAFISAEKMRLPDSITSFLRGRKYIYIQNPFDFDRGLIESVTMISKYSDFCLLVSGNIPINIMEHINKNFSNSFIASNVFFTGWVNDLSLVSFMDNAYASIVIYKFTNHSSKYHSLNNRYAASNSLYQSLCRGTPVLTGCNEGTSQTVNQMGAGVVMNDDGSSNELIKSFQYLNNNYESIKNNCTLKKDILSWESQEQVLISSVIG